MFRFFFIIFAISVTSSSAIKAIRLNDGHMIPPIAYGTFGKLSDVKKIGPLVVYAIEAGYRHFDTSPMYYTEEEIGHAIINVTSRGIVTRKELFITTKYDELTNHSSVVPALRKSLERLQLDYVDLYLIHLSHSEITLKEVNYMDIWKGMEDAKRLGLTKSIGVSNFNSTHINKILANYIIRPAVNQIEVNPSYTELDLVAYCQSQGIHVMSYGPFGFLVPRPFTRTSPPPKFNNTLLEKIAKKYRKSTSQVVLRYLLDRGTIPIPKSLNKTHIASNINIFDFSLQPKEVYKINEFNSDTKVYLNEGGYEIANVLYLYYYGTTVDKLDSLSNQKAVLPALKKSLKKLQLNYVDLYLIHNPKNSLTDTYIDYVGVWKGMEEVKLQGLARSIGISNFNSSQINRILANSKIKPAVNQVERPFKNFRLPPTFNDPTLVKIAKKYGKETSQIVIRYLVDLGTVPIPKSTNREHIKTKINIFDFSLTQQEVYEINEFNLNTAVYDFKDMDSLYKYMFGRTVEEVVGLVNKM